MFRTVLVVVFCEFVVVVVASSPAFSVSLYSVVSMMSSSTSVFARACSPERSAVSADKATSDFLAVVIF